MGHYGQFKKIKSLKITIFASEDIIAFIHDQEAVIFEPSFKIFDDVTSNSFVFDDTILQLKWSGFKLRL